MNWIAIGLIAGSIISSGHADKESCLGRIALLKEQKVERVQCVDMQSTLSSGSAISYGRLQLCSGGTCQ